ncbi:MAG: zinc ribbon domain-containing protein, partial [Methanolinea sp.]|nr:zinc ribbon domain-containing protein [Methanolinea sp.]
MSTSNAFCPGCGSPRSPGAKFCRKCRMKFDEKSTAEQTIDTLHTVSKTAESVKSTISTAESAIQTASQVKDFVITPPAQWKVVIGDRLPGIGQAAATKATQMAQEKIETVVKEKVGDMVKETINNPPAQGTVTRAATIPTAGSSVCYSCGKQVKA